MKKILSVLLASLMILLVMVPAFAEDTTGDAKLKFYAPGWNDVSVEPDAYTFVKMADGTLSYHAVTVGRYIAYTEGSGVDLNDLAADLPAGSVLNNRVSLDVLFEACKTKGLTRRDVVYKYLENGTAVLYESADATEALAPASCFVLASGKYVEIGTLIFPEDRDTVFDALFDEGATLYTYDAYDTAEEGITVAKGDIVSFKIRTSPKYDAATASVYVNNTVLYPNQAGEYSFVAGAGLNEIKVNEGTLLRSHFTVTLTKGDGYAVKTLKNDNNKVAFYGDSFKFRVKITKGFTDAGMKVTVLRGSNELSELIGEEFDAALAMIGEGESLKSTGIDEDGFKTFEVKNITTDCKIVVSGVREQSQSGILAVLKKILRFILHLFGIESPMLDDTLGLTAYTFDITNQSSVDYEIIAGAGGDVHARHLDLLKGDTVGIKLTKYDINENASVYVVEDGAEKPYEYSSEWTIHYDSLNDRNYWTKIVYFDSVDSNLEVVIKP